MSRDRAVFRYGLAVLATAVAVAFSVALRFLGVRSSLSPLIFAVAVTALYGGIGPGLLAMVLGAIAFTLINSADFPEPMVTFPEQTILLVEFIIISALIILVSERSRRSAERATDSLARLDALFDTTPIGLAFLDSDLRIQQVNRALAELSRVPESALVGQEVTSLSSVVKASQETVLRRVISTGEPVLNQEEVVQLPRGPIDTLASAYPVRTPTGKTLGVGIVLLDISAQKQAEAARERLVREQAARASSESERARLQAILEQSPLGITYVDAATGELLTNRAVSEMLGVSTTPALGLGQYVGKVRRPDGQPYTIDELPISRALRGEALQRVDVQIRKPTGQSLPAQVNAVPIYDAQRRIVGAVGSWEDVSDLREQERRREEWISVIAHDLRQPVTVILGYSDLLMRQIERIRPALVPEVEHIRTSARQLNRLVGDLLDVSRIEAARLALQCAETDLVALVREVVQRDAEITRGHPVIVEVQEEILYVNLDPQRIEQVLTNLLSNAAKYGEPGTEIVVRVQSTSVGARVAVTNRGLGIAPADLPRLFSRFFRTKAVGDEKIPGLGLGLYISRGLVEAHGGQMNVVSRPGETTTFSFTLPRSGRRENSHG